MTKCVNQPLRDLAGRPASLDIRKKVREPHHQHLRAEGDLLLECRYETRWPGDLLRRDGVVRPPNATKRAVWESTADRPSPASHTEDRPQLEQCRQTPRSRARRTTR